jgi:hypothetical protein
MDWCRLYGEMLDDPKVGTLDDAQFRTWVELLMVATKADANGNTRLTVAETSINWALRRNATVTLQELLQRELVTLNEIGEIVITEWDKRQKKSDSSADRVAKHRANQRLSDANDSETLQKRDGNGLDKSREDKSREETKPKNTRAPRFDAQAHLESLGVDSKVARDWLKLRKEKRLAPTETAFQGVMDEAKKAGISMNEALLTCCKRGWGGFEAKWLSAKPLSLVPASKQGRHSGFDQIDYRDGVSDDGSF